MEGSARVMTFEEAWEWIREHEIYLIDLILSGDEKTSELMKLLVEYSECQDRLVGRYQSTITSAVESIIHERTERENKQ